MYTGSLRSYYGETFIHKESGREATIRETELFVKMNDFAHEWTQCISYSMTDLPDAVFVCSVDSFRAKFDVKTGEQS